MQIRFFHKKTKEEFPEFHQFLIDKNGNVLEVVYTNYDGSQDLRERSKIGWEIINEEKK